MLTKTTSPHEEAEKEEVHVDSSTAVPLDLYLSLMGAGEAAKRRGQHRLEHGDTSPGGGRRRPHLVSGIDDAVRAVTPPQFQTSLQLQLPSRALRPLPLRSSSWSNVGSEGECALIVDDHTPVGVPSKCSLDVRCRGRVVEERHCIVEVGDPRYLDACEEEDDEASVSVLPPSKRVATAAKSAAAALAVTATSFAAAVAGTPALDEEAKNLAGHIGGIWGAKKAPKRDGKANGDHTGFLPRVSVSGTARAFVGFLGFARQRRKAQHVVPHSRSVV
eukprot:TRINITY_DN35980_c0_g1_i1.p1 TRINITY_DN35980_c0_g1~~TRINITY_DN35980_c0_g1_i1.p1  ORF type:complete len:301 (-),score=62.66 TRINITY_DN35980_c0_g1_i1:55-879(-)